MSHFQPMILVPIMCSTGDPFAFIADVEPYSDGCFGDDSSIDKDFEAEIEEVFSDCISLVIDDSNLNWSIEDLQVQELIGYGSYGRVHRAWHPPTQQNVALKFVDKRKLASSRGFSRHHAMERKILPMVSKSRFVARCLGILETKSDVIFIEEYVPGGELYYHLQQRKSGTFIESQVRFYASEVVCMLQDLHAMEVLYRDLKPENLVLDSKGHLKLVDFGLATILESKLATACTYCGTAEYIAPEVLRGQHYGVSVDMWGLGCVIFEMLTGYPPFYSDNQNTMFARILTETVKVPKPVSDDLLHLLTGLLHKDWRKRLTLPQVTNHPWFKEINWSKVRRQQMTPPIIPNGQETRMQALMPENVQYAKELGKASVSCPRIPGLRGISIMDDDDIDEHEAKAVNKRNYDFVSHVSHQTFPHDNSSSSSLCSNF